MISRNPDVRIVMTNYVCVRKQDRQTVNNKIHTWNGSQDYLNKYEGLHKRERKQRKIKFNNNNLWMLR